MLISYDIVTAFGVSALISFVVFTGLLLMMAALSGYLRATKGNMKVPLKKPVETNKLLHTVAMPEPSAPEPTPPMERRLLEAHKKPN